MRILFLALAFLLSVSPARAGEQKYYDYVFNGAEYSIRLPEAPSVRTIWTNDGLTLGGLVDDYPTDSATVGEIAYFTRTDIDTEENYSIKIFTLKAKPHFIETITGDDISNRFKKYLKKEVWDKESFQMVGNDKLKWATLSGFSTDSGHRPVFNALHYLVGQENIIVIEARYNFQNKKFQEYYTTMINNVVYHAP